MALVCALALHASAQIDVTAKPATISTRSFDPENPPREMPPLKSGEAAVCSSNFVCGVQVEVEISQVEGQKPQMKVTAVNADLSLDIVIWLPIEASEKIRRHEEGHRRISEHFYARAEATAKELAASYIGRELTISSIEPTATQPVIQRIASEFCQEYLGTIEAPSEKAQERYDKLTDHGRNRVDENEAIRRAINDVRARPSGR